ncbi:MAG: four helix bundle protein [Candidatus Dojkabacteria bacterium]
MENKISSYKDLSIWKKSINLSVKIYQYTENFPAKEVYGITNQLRRSSVSIPSNIAEGSRRTTKDFINFLRISLGSLSELETQTLISFKINYLNEKQYEELLNDMIEISKMIVTLIKRLK